MTPSLAKYRWENSPDRVVVRSEAAPNGPVPAKGKRPLTDYIRVLWQWEDGIDAAYFGSVAFVHPDLFDAFIAAHRPIREGFLKRQAG